MGTEELGRQAGVLGIVQWCFLVGTEGDAGAGSQSAPGAWHAACMCSHPSAPHTSGKPSISHMASPRCVPALLGSHQPLRGLPSPLAAAPQLPVTLQRGGGPGARHEHGGPVAICGWQQPRSQEGRAARCCPPRHHPAPLPSRRWRPAEHRQRAPRGAGSGLAAPASKAALRGTCVSNSLPSICMEQASGVVSWYSSHFLIPGKRRAGSCWQPQRHAVGSRLRAGPPAAFPCGQPAPVWLCPREGFVRSPPGSARHRAAEGSGASSGRVWSFGALHFGFR